MFDDYSLIKLRSRLAAEGEEVIVHRFRSGNTRMVARPDFEHWLRSTTHDANNSADMRKPSAGLWESIKNYCTGFLTHYGFMKERGI
ncbi:MAG TPA: hypothetical protein VMH05_19995, partial [Bryobacteraceae bacterium]|nr:hypothetical protein [Bryobacteraceae bacterium]